MLRTTADRSSRERGAVLIVALSVLALLTVFAVSFTSLLRLEAAAATNLSDALRARLVAEAGVERAVYLLSASELADPVSSFHSPWTYRGQDGARWGHGLPLELARNPSFKEGVTADGLAYSGIVGSTYRASEGDLFALQVVDAASRLSLNSAQPSLGAMLDALGRAIREYDRRRALPGDPLHDPGWVELLATRRAELLGRGLAPEEVERRLEPRDPVAGRGEQVVALREALGGRFTRVEQLRSLLGDDESLARLRDHVTVDAWLDAAMFGLRPDGAGGVALVPERRAPVNVNTASWPVLVACFAGVEAARSIHPDDAALRVSEDQARELATRVELHRRGDGVSWAGEAFRGWLDWRWFLDGQKRDPAADPGDPDAPPLLSPTQRAALLAAGDPNLLHARRNPDGSVHPGLGKADLLCRSGAGGRLEVGYTTELCFISWGHFLVTSLGRIRGPDGQVLAEARVEAAVAVYDTIRLLTQADFEAAADPDYEQHTASFPNPVRAMIGAFLEAEPDGDEPAPAIPDPALRKQLRIQLASNSSGYVQLAVRRGQLRTENLNLLASYYYSLFRFETVDLRGEIWRWLNPLSEDDMQVWPPGVQPQGFVHPDLPCCHACHDRPQEPEPPPCETCGQVVHRGCWMWISYPLRLDRLHLPAAGSLAERVRGFARAGGVPDDPRILGEGAAVAPPVEGGRPVYGEDLSPLGLLVRPEREAGVHYPNMPAGANNGNLAILQDRSGILVWFQLNQSDLEAWTPLLEAWVPTTTGVEPGDWVKMQVEARLIHQPQGPGYWLEVRSRRFSGRGDDNGLVPRQIYAGPPSEEEDFNLPLYARHVRLALDEARASEWHYLYVPCYANVHFPFVDGLAGEDVTDAAEGLSSWALPTWPPELRDHVAPGGFVHPALPARPPFAEATLDELATTSYSFEVLPDRYRREMLDLRTTREPRPGEATPAREQRFFAAGPDWVGGYVAELPPFDQDVRMGRLLWTEYVPDRWGRIAFEKGEFQTQSTYRYSRDAARRHLSGVALAPPDLALMSDVYVRYWRLRYLTERRGVLQGLIDHYQALIGTAAGDAASRATFQGVRTILRRELTALDDEERAILQGFGPPVPPADAGSSLAFRELDVQTAGQAVRFHIDFVYFDRRLRTAIGADGQERYQSSVLNTSPVLDDVIVTYQQRPRVLRFEVQ